MGIRRAIRLSTTKAFGGLARVLIRRAYQNSASSELLVQDAGRWKTRTVEQTFLTYPEFRSLFYKRVGSNSRFVWILRLLYPPQAALFIYTKQLGGGVFIQHGFATIISAKSIGRNCWINQQVTIGYTNATDCPTLGDHVVVNAGAIVIGNVTLGDRCRVGAGAVVVKSVPPDCTVVGNPARIVRRNGVRVDEAL
jgi:serine O-acetyltransferase